MDEPKSLSRQIDRWIQSIRRPYRLIIALGFCYVFNTQFNKLNAALADRVTDAEMIAIQLLEFAVGFLILGTTLWGWPPLSWNRRLGAASRK